MELLSTRSFGDDKVRVFEDSKVLHHPEPGHLGQDIHQRVERLAVVTTEMVEQETTASVGKRLEDEVEIIHW